MSQQTTAAVRLCDASSLSLGTQVDADAAVSAESSGTDMGTLLPDPRLVPSTAPHSLNHSHDQSNNQPCSSLTAAQQQAGSAARDDPHAGAESPAPSADVNRSRGPSSAPRVTKRPMLSEDDASFQTAGDAEAVSKDSLEQPPRKKRGRRRRGAGAGPTSEQRVKTDDRPIYRPTSAWNLYVSGTTKPDDTPMLALTLA